LSTFLFISPKNAKIDKILTFSFLLGAVDMRLSGGFSSEFQRIFCEEDADGLPPFKDDEEKRCEISRKDAKSFSWPQPLVTIKTHAIEKLAIHRFTVIVVFRSFFHEHI